MLGTTDNQTFTFAPQEEATVVVVGSTVFRVPCRSLTVREVHQILRVSESVVRDRVSRGLLVQVPREMWPNGKCSLITPESVNDYLRYNSRAARRAPSSA